MNDRRGERPIDLDRRAEVAKKLIADKRRPPAYHEDGLWALELEGRIEEVDAIHVLQTVTGFRQDGTLEQVVVCRGCSSDWPCKTHRILHGEGQ